jgi:hypothetical protein
LPKKTAVCSSKPEGFWRASNLFYAQQAPFLLRNQAELGARDIFSQNLRFDPATAATVNSMLALMQQADSTFQSMAKKPEIVEASMKFMASFASLAETLHKIQESPATSARLPELTGQLRDEIRVLRESIFAVGGILLFLAFVLAVLARVLSAYVIRRWIGAREEGGARENRAA